MNRLANCLVLTALTLAGFSSQREAPLQAQPPSAGVGFRNDTSVPVIVQGWSLVNGMQRRGQPLLVNPGKTAWDNSVPNGIRYFNIYDANQTSRVLLRDRPVRVQGVDQFFGIRFLPGDPSRVTILQEPLPVP